MNTITFNNNEDKWQRKSFKQGISGNDDQNDEIINIFSTLKV